MTQLMTTATFPKALKAGVMKFWGNDDQEYQPQYTDLFEMKKSTKAYEEVVEVAGFGLASVKPEANSLNYSTQSQGYTSRFTNVPYALGYIISHEAIQDNQYMDLIERQTPDLKFSMRQTHETVAANVYNRAFNGSYLGGDGVSLISTSHPTFAGNQANALAAGADLSETSLEDLCILIMNMKDNKGRHRKFTPQSLHVPPALWFEANRIVNSVLQNNTANNAVNVIKMTNQFPKGIKINNYFTSTTSYFIRTDCQWSMLHFQREDLSIDQDGEFDTKTLKYAAYERYSLGWGNWRGLVGNEGN